MFCGSSFADGLFGIKLGDDVKKYKVEKLREYKMGNEFKIKPKNPNQDFEKYIVEATKRDKIYVISATLKRSFDSEKSCKQRLQYYIDIVHERLKKTKTSLDLAENQKVYLDHNNKVKLHLIGGCFKFDDFFWASIKLSDWIEQQDISKKGL